MPAASAALENFTIANRLHWSVTATAGMPALAQAFTSGFMRTTPLTREYTVWTLRWTKAGVMGGYSIRASPAQRWLDTPQRRRLPARLFATFMQMPSQVVVVLLLTCGFVALHSVVDLFRHRHRTTRPRCRRACGGAYACVYNSPPAARPSPNL